jgi:DNA-binding MarR family transcriptional regulator
MKEMAAAERGKLGDVLDFMRLLWAVDHALQSTSKRMESRLGITGPQRLVIRIVGRVPGISAGELAEIMHVHPSTLTGILKRLDGRGMITRKPDPKDARRALFALTAKGREVDALRSGTVEAAVRRALTRLSEPQIAATAEVLGAVAAELSRDQV